MKGSKMLLVSSIILIVCQTATAIFMAFIYSISTFIELIFKHASVSEDGLVKLTSNFFLLFQFAVAILGIVSYKKTELVQTCFLLGIITLVLQAISLIATHFEMPFSLIFIQLYSIIAIAPSAFYTLGAWRQTKNNKII